MVSTNSLKPLQLVQRCEALFTPFNPEQLLKVDE
jgi:hypothetical protein